MDEKNFLAEQFKANRTHLKSVAYRMLGSTSEAEDALQEAWIRLSRTDTAEVKNLGGWLTTVISRVCLDMLRTRKSRREDVFDAETHEAAVEPEVAAIENESILADSVGLAMLVVLQQLAPAERIAFVLHDMFDLPFDEIGPIVDRSPVAAPAGACKVGRRRTRRRSPAIGRSSTPFSPPRATAILPACLPYSTPMSSSAPTRPRCGSARWLNCVAPRPSASTSRAGRAMPRSRSSMARSASWSPHQAISCWC